MKEDLVTQAEFARRIGVTQNAVCLAVKAGRVKVKVKNGRKYLNYTREKHNFNRTADKVKVSRPGPKGKGSAGVDRGNGRDIYDLPEARLKLETFKAKKAELEYEELRGTLIKTADVKREWTELAINLKKSILAIPARIGPLAAAESNPHQCTQLLTVELKRALENIVKKNNKEVLR